MVLFSGYVWAGAVSVWDGVVPGNGIRGADMPCVGDDPGAAKPWLTTSNVAKAAKAETAISARRVPVPSAARRCRPVAERGAR